MSSSSPIDDLLQRIAALLAAHGEPDWAKCFENFTKELADSPDTTRTRIRSIYGGMGSFNDLILHDANGIPLRDENDNLDRMRSDLYSKCQN